MTCLVIALFLVGLPCEPQAVSAEEVCEDVSVVW